MGYIQEESPPVKRPWLAGCRPVYTLAQAGSGSGGKHERISRKGECNNRRRISGRDGPYTLSRSASRPLKPSITTFVIHPHPPLHVTTMHLSRFPGRGQAPPWLVVAGYLYKRYPPDAQVAPGMGLRSG